MVEGVQQGPVLVGTFFTCSNNFKSQMCGFEYYCFISWINNILMIRQQLQDIP